MIVPSLITVVQGRPDALLPADIAPGTDASHLAFGQATVSADMVKAGGFDSLTLTLRRLHAVLRQRVAWRSVAA